jgi:hypothetical protein
LLNTVTMQNVACATGITSEPTRGEVGTAYRLVRGERLGDDRGDPLGQADEQAVMPSLRPGPKGTAVVNAQGRVVLSNSARHVSGTLIRDPDVAGLWTTGDPRLHRIDDLPLALVDLA